MANDHDLLIEVATKVRTICTSVADIKGEVKDLRDSLPCSEVQKTCTAKMDKKADWNRVWAMIALIVVVFGGALAFNWKTDLAAHERVIRNETRIEELHRGE